VSRQVLATLAGAAVLALMGGCGDSGGEALTKAEFVERGDLICKKVPTEIASGYKAFVKKKGLKKGEFPDKAENYEIAEDVYLAARQHQVEALRDLNPPVADQDKVDAMLTETEDGIARIRKNLKVLFEAEKKNPLETSAKEYTSYGFKVCGTV
jgi:hypothetical protein